MKEKTQIMYKFHSYKFAPAHYYTLEAFLSDEGIRKNASFALDRRYYDFGSLEVCHLGDNSDKTIHVHLNSSFFTLLHIIMCWFLGRDTIILMHEPILDLPEKLKYYSNFKKIMKIIIIKYINDLICLFSKKIIVFSKTAEKNLRPRLKYKSIRRKLPFVLSEITKNELKKSEKIQICYIGTIADDHNFNAYIDWVENSRLDRAYFNFSIFTRDSLNSEDKRRLTNLCDISDGNVLSMSEMAAIYDNSHFTWCVYSSSSQSGVLPMALMHGSVPLVSEAFGEDIVDYSNCTILISNFLPSALDSKILCKMNDLRKLEKAAREAYHDQHNPEYKNWGQVLNV